MYPPIVHYQWKIKRSYELGLFLVVAEAHEIVGISIEYLLVCAELAYVFTGHQIILMQLKFELGSELDLVIIEAFDDIQYLVHQICLTHIWLGTVVLHLP